MYVIVVSPYVPQFWFERKDAALFAVAIDICPVLYITIIPIGNSVLPDAIRIGQVKITPVAGLISAGSAKLEEFMLLVADPLLLLIATYGMLIVTILVVPSVMYFAVKFGDDVPKKIGLNTGTLTIRVYAVVSNVASPLTNPDPDSVVASPFIIELALLVVKVPLPNTT